MSLTIRKFQTRCRYPRSLRHPAALIDDVAREHFASELHAQLGPSLDRLPTVVRLKDLRVRLKVPGRNLTPSALANAWARAFTIAIHRALAYPSGDGVVASRRYPIPAAYKAELLHHIATQGVAPSWQFPELKLLQSYSRNEATLAVLFAETNLIPAVFGELDRQNRLDLLLSLWDDLALERIIQALSEQDNTPRSLDLNALIELGCAAASTRGLRTHWPVGSRRQAIRLWMQTNRRWPLRAVWHGLRLLLRFLETPALLISRNPELLADPIPFPQWCRNIIRGSSPFENPRDARTSGRVSSSLIAALDALRPLAPSAASPVAAGRATSNVNWISSDYAGILLMLPVVLRLDLTRFIRKPEFIRFGGVRAFSFFLAAIGMSLLKRSPLQDRLESAAAIFAGMLLDPDLAGMRDFFRTTDVAAIADFVPARTWTDAFDLAAVELSTAFAARVRGFRKASRDAVFKQFLHIPGRILIEDARLLVILNSTPFATPLHLSGMDDPIETIDWLGGRRVEFLLEGL